jgi:hypothetical protein
MGLSVNRYVRPILLAPKIKYCLELGKAKPRPNSNSALLALEALTDTRIKYAPSSSFAVSTYDLGSPLSAPLLETVNGQHARPSSVWNYFI